MGTRSLHSVVLSRRGRRSDYNAYRQAWQQNYGGAAPYAKDMDDVLHRERTVSHRMPWTAVPDGVFVETDYGPAVVVGGHLAVFDEDAYAYRRLTARPVDGSASVLTHHRRWQC